jgi:hypothetical protein
MVQLVSPNRLCPFSCHKAERLKKLFRLTKYGESKDFCVKGKGKCEVVPVLN